MIIIDDKGYTQLTVDHRLDNTEERQRIEQAGGIIRSPYVYKDGEGVMPTRTIGDQYFKDVGVIATPSVNSYAIKQEDITLLAADDGVFDFIKNEDVAEVARKIRDPKELLEALKKEVLLERGGSDNLTAIAVELLH